MVQENLPVSSFHKNTSVMIAGGSGLIGSHLTSHLLSAGYSVSHLTRSRGNVSGVRTYLWDPEKNIIDPEALEKVDYLIHLAGANIGEKRWTGRRKSEIIKSRVDSAGLLYKVISENKIPLKAFITASAVGYYGSLTTDKIFVEGDPPADDFLGSVCASWEAAADLFGNMRIRTVKIRTGVVLGKNDSALSKMMMSAKYGFLVQTGNGSQYMPWIHIDDICKIYLKAIEDPNMNGPYNAVSPQHVTHKKFVKTLARVIGKPVLQIPVPEFILRAALGEMSDVILKGSRVSSQKILDSGYRFKLSQLEDALIDIIYR
jgi:uncharacterized protein (TIGR01777 family)